MYVHREKFITRKMIQENPYNIFIFGDNVKRVGFGGQAKEMRGEPNSFGIATKLAPTYNPKDFMYDCPEHMKIVQDDFDRLYKELSKRRTLDALGEVVHPYYYTIVFPKDGIGTGIAKLKENAPLILSFINYMFDEEIPRWRF